MAERENLEAGIKAYIEAANGQLIEAAAWNDLQRCSRQDIRKHRHTGDGTTDDGMQIGTEGLEGSAVTELKIADSAVTELKIADSAVSGNKIADGAVTLAKLGADVELNSEIPDSAVTELKIADSAVTELKIADSAVSGNKIADGAVTMGKLGADVTIGGDTDSITCTFPVSGDMIIENVPDKFRRTNNTGYAQAAEAGGAIHLVWNEHNPDTTVNRHTIWHAAMQTDGTVVQVPRQVFDCATGNNQEPRVASDASGNIHVVWQGYNSAISRYDVWYGKIPAGGGALASHKLVSGSASPDLRADNPLIAADAEGNLHIVYRRYPVNSRYALWYAKLDSNGNILPDMHFNLIGDTSFNYYTRGLAVQSDEVHLFYSSDQYYHAELDLDGKIIVPGANFMIETGLNHPQAVATDPADGNLMVCTGYSGRMNFRKMDADHMLVPGSARVLEPQYNMQSMAYDTEGNLHIPVRVSGNDIGWLKLDMKGYENMTLTDLLHTYRDSNF